MEKKNITLDVEYARKRLGKRAEKLTDKQIENLLNTLRVLANKAIDSVVENSVH